MRRNRSRIYKNKTRLTMFELDVKLLGVWNSPFSRRIEIALNKKGVEYEYIEEDLQNKSPELLKYNPIHQKVPVLFYEGKAIVESQVILEYIDETWKANAIMPQDPYDRAMARFWVKFIDEKCIPSFREAFWGPEDQQENSVEEACENLKRLENELKGKRFFGGENIGIVDIAASFIGYWLGAIQEAAEKQLLTEEAFPLLCKWKDEFLNSDIVKEKLPPRDRLVDFYRIRIEAAKAAM